eukprot:scaffold21808_cov123-Isochrysis_galbana.AAC.8
MQKDNREWRRRLVPPGGRPRGAVPVPQRAGAEQAEALAPEPAADEPHLRLEHQVEPERLVRLGERLAGVEHPIGGAAVLGRKRPIQHPGKVVDKRAERGSLPRR